MNKARSAFVAFLMPSTASAARCLSSHISWPGRMARPVDGWRVSRSVVTSELLKVTGRPRGQGDQLDVIAGAGPDTGLGAVAVALDRAAVPAAAGLARGGVQLADGHQVGRRLL